MPDEVLTIKEVAALLKLAEKTVYAMANAGELPAFKIRGQWRIKRAELDQWIDERPRGGGEERDGEEIEGKEKLKSKWSALEALVGTERRLSLVAQDLVDQEEAVALMLEKHEVCCGLFHGFDWSAWTTDTPAERLSVLPAAQEHVLAQEGGKERILQVVTELSKAFALAVPHDEAIRIRDDVGFFQAVRTAIAKSTAGDRKASGDLDLAIRQIVSKAVSSDQVIDIFAAAGLKNPDISILSDQFLSEVRGMQHKNLAVELLRKLLNDEEKARSRHNVVQSRSFAELLSDYWTGSAG